MAKRLKPTTLFTPGTGLATRASRPRRMKKGATSLRESQQLKTADPRYRIGIVDLDVHVGYLSEVFSAVNRAQGQFVFQTVTMPIRAGLMMSGERTQQIVRKLGGQIPRSRLAKHVYAPDLFEAAKPLVKTTTFDTVGLLVSRMIIEGNTKKTLEWNLFSTGEGRTFIASAYKLNRDAARVGRSFEACVAFVVVAQAFSALFSRVAFHDETRGCLFDYCAKGSDILKGLRTMTICDPSLGEFPPSVRKDVSKIVRAIRNYHREDVEAPLDKRSRGASKSALSPLKQKKKG